MKLLGLSHIKEADRLTVKNQKITFLDLMERAGLAVFNTIHERLQGAQVPIHVFCGLGNNGGDGLVIARHLVEHGYNVTTYIVNFSTNRSEAFLVNYDRLKAIDNEWPIQLKGEEDIPTVSSNDMVIDAIFGIGLNRQMEPWVKKLISYINASNVFVLSIDVPSGLYAEKSPEDETAVIYSNVCLTFQAPKLIFFLPETAKYAQDVDFVDIGLDTGYLNEVDTKMDLILKNEVLKLYRPREKFSHKGTYGHTLLIGGSKGKIGSMLLASKACLRVGAGLVSALIPECGYHVIQTGIPEVMVVDHDNDDYLEDFKFELDPSVICIGMGLGMHKKTILAFAKFLKENTKPLVIDADAINILSENSELLDYIPRQTVLTPHAKELERLIGVWNDDFEKLEKVKLFSKKYDCILIIKGANSITVYHDEIYVNTTGNPGMATAGAGDVLAGMISGLISQGYGALQASIFGVYMHGSAGDIAVNGLGYQALLASDIVDKIGPAYLELFKQPEQPVNA
ncbi:NAD(P)H-hydrate dehydratase [Aquimarina agarilytica]|uniref:NAD(P)H-hydrate dehydratase n=1 Tax=Aquimarina agarilytica TaxID=1087449 RepID=UPI000289F095|nr:NAD(P)H-hydrate dehydratase [Aquimarina agarilytica]